MTALLGNASSVTFLFVWWVGLVTIALLLAGTVVGIYWSIRVGIAFRKAQRDVMRRHVEAFIDHALGGDTVDHDREELP